MTLSMACKNVHLTYWQHPFCARAMKSSTNTLMYCSHCPLVGSHGSLIGGMGMANVWIASRNGAFG